MPLARRRDPFDHRDWLFELKLDGSRALAFVDSDGVRFVSRKGLRFRRFDGLCGELAQVLKGHAVVLDGEVVCLDAEVRPQFHTLLLARR